LPGKKTGLRLGKGSREKNRLWDSLVEKGGKFFMRSTDYIATVGSKTNSAKLLVLREKIDSARYFVRLLYSLLGLKFNAFLLHSSAFERNGKAFVFFGPGGSGKTTVARANSGNATVINDDLNVVRKIGGRFFAFGNPFYLQNFSAGNFGAEIDSIYFLKKDERNYLKRMNSVDAIALLFNSITFGNKNSEAAEKLLQLCQELVEKCPCFEFHFAKETLSWRQIECK